MNNELQTIDQESLAIANSLVGTEEKDHIKMLPLIKLYQPDIKKYRKNGDELPLGSLYVEIKDLNTGERKKEVVAKELVGQVLSRTYYLSVGNNNGEQWYTAEILDFSQPTTLIKKTYPAEKGKKPITEELKTGSYQDVRDYIKSLGEYEQGGGLNLKPTFIQNIYFYIFESKEYVKIQAKGSSRDAVWNYINSFPKDRPVQYWKTNISIGKSDEIYYNHILKNEGQLPTAECLERLKEFAVAFKTMQEHLKKGYSEKDVDNAMQANREVASSNNDEINPEEIPF